MPRIPGYANYQVLIPLPALEESYSLDYRAALVARRTRTSQHQLTHTILVHRWTDTNNLLVLVLLVEQGVQNQVLFFQTEPI